MSESRLRYMIDFDELSRYGDYLYSRKDGFVDLFDHDYSDPSVRFALEAWRIATGPVMSPPFVLAPRQVLGTAITPNDWTGDAAIIDVQLACPAPTVLHNLRAADGSYFRSWSTEWDGGFKPVGDREVADSPYLFTRAQVLAQVPAAELPTVTALPAASGRLLGQAVECVQALVYILNRQIGPIVDRLDGR